MENAERIEIRSTPWSSAKRTDRNPFYVKNYRPEGYLGKAKARVSLASPVTFDTIREGDLPHGDGRRFPFMSGRWMALLLLSGAALAGWACNSATNVPRQSDIPAPLAAIEESKGPAIFADVTGRSGIKFIYRNGEEANHLTIFESVGGGVGVIDYDGDGLMDLFFPGGGVFTGPDKKEIVGEPCKLYRNLGNGTFKDVTAEVGLDRLAGGQPWFYTHGVAVADFDRDGRPDLLVTGWGRVALFRNVDGKRFEDVTATAGLDKGITWGVSAAWADLDGDGYPDLYITQYVDWSFNKNPTCNYGSKLTDICAPKFFHGLTHKVYRNKGDGTFTDVSDTCGLVKGGPHVSNGLGVLAIDLDGDGKPDIYVCNDGTDKFLYLNRSTRGNIRFEERGMSCGVACNEDGGRDGSMGVDAGDYDGSGKPSLWVTNYETQLHGLYRFLHSDDLPYFRFETTAAGISVIGRKYVGWGTAFIDFDLDGWEDLFVSHGHALRRPVGEGRGPGQKPVLLLNQGNGKFLPAPKRMGPYGETDHRGRGVAFVDLDNDGRVDVVISHMNEPATVLRNIAAPEHHWLGVQLVGAGHADVVGAKIMLEAGGRKQTRFAKGGGSYASTSDRRLVFGLGKTERIDRLSVTWPDGMQQQWTGLGTDRYHVLTQGQQETRE
jgi:hypothetical protein